MKLSSTFALLASLASTAKGDYLLGTSHYINFSFPLGVNATKEVSWAHYQTTEVLAQLNFDQVATTVATYGSLIKDAFTTAEGSVSSACATTYWGGTYNAATIATGEANYTSFLFDPLNTTSDATNNTLTLGATADYYKCVYPKATSPLMSLRSALWDHIQDINLTDGSFAAMPTEAANYEQKSYVGLARRTATTEASVSNLNLFSQLHTANSSIPQSFSLMYSPAFAGNRSMGTNRPPPPAHDGRSNDEFFRAMEEEERLMASEKKMFLDIGTPNSNQTALGAGFLKELSLTENDAKWLSADTVSSYVIDGTSTDLTGSLKKVNFGVNKTTFGVPTSLLTAMKRAYNTAAGQQFETSSYTALNCSAIDMNNVKEINLTVSADFSIKIPPHAQFIASETDPGKCQWAFHEASSDTWELGFNVLSQFYTTYTLGAASSGDKVTISYLLNHTMPRPVIYDWEPWYDDVHCPECTNFDNMTTDEIDAYIFDNSWNNMTIDNRMDLFNADDLDDGDYHWENGLIGELCFVILKYVGSDAAEVVIALFTIAGWLSEVMPGLNMLMAPQYDASSDPYNTRDQYTPPPDDEPYMY